MKKLLLVVLTVVMLPISRSRSVTLIEPKTLQTSND